MAERLENIFSFGFSYIIGAIFAVCWCIIVVRAIKNRYAREKTVKAQVLDKYKSQPLSWHPGTLNRTKYVVVFGVKNKKISFPVSEFSFAGYRVKEKGTLKYKGNKIIEFK